MAENDRIQKLKRLLEADPNDAFLLYGVGQEYAKAGDHERAIESFDRALTADADYIYAYFFKARSLEVLSRSGEAVDVLREGIKRATSAGDEKALGELNEYLESMQR